MVSEWDRVVFFSNFPCVSSWERSRFDRIRSLIKMCFGCRKLRFKGRKGERTENEEPLQKIF